MQRGVMRRTIPTGIISNLICVVCSLSDISDIEPRLRCGLRKSNFLRHFAWHPEREPIDPASVITPWQMPNPRRRTLRPRRGRKRNRLKRSPPAQHPPSPGSPRPSRPAPKLQTKAPPGLARRQNPERRGTHPHHVEIQKNRTTDRPRELTRTLRSRRRSIHRHPTLPNLTKPCRRKKLNGRAKAIC